MTTEIPTTTETTTPPITTTTTSQPTTTEPSTTTTTSPPTTTTASTTTEPTTPPQTTTEPTTTTSVTPPQTTTTPSTTTPDESYPPTSTTTTSSTTSTTPPRELCEIVPGVPKLEELPSSRRLSTAEECDETCEGMNVCKYSALSIDGMCILMKVAMNTSSDYLTESPECNSRRKFGHIKMTLESRPKFIHLNVILTATAAMCRKECFGNDACHDWQYNKFYHYCTMLKLDLKSTLITMTPLPTTPMTIPTVPATTTMIPSTEQPQRILWKTFWG
eukprot:TRINITY_DN12534_c0_g1_i1.p1 TRINITY_DN12534_c0_g1~~TRINITY_DN12534_c0_g1_i1.p1  ORF type:complete len:321 (-),score=103.51 TRINITY_DN12534_c0_g1_i1:129-953(-)